MKYSGFCLLLWGLLSVHSVFASAPLANDETSQLQGIVKTLMDDNSAYVKSHRPAYYKPFVDEQHPRATVVTCSDSRVQMHALDKSPDNDLYVVRNIGNQIATTEGSVEYGIHHLHTPLLIIIGHVACGAIKAAQGDFSKEPAAIRREVGSIRLPVRNSALDENEEWLHGVDANVNNQVAYALKKFSNEVKAGKLTVIGSIYDFQNALQQGQGRLVITNINGDTNAGSIMSGLMQLSGAAVKLEKKPH